jgi:cellulose synthase/poly-beta-1,6-N-acetylglucosamine synthase-like glycosyltransferase
MIGDVVPLIMLVGISALALLLRETESWEFTLLAAIAIGVCVEIYLRVQPAVLDVLMAQVEIYLQNNNPQDLQIADVRNAMVTVIGAVYMFLSIMLLMLARWMQAALYNPGGFKQEFHRLRVEQKVGLILIAAMLLASFGVLIPEAWVLYLVIPLLFSGIALVHAVVAIKNLSRMWLVTFYVLLMLPITVQMLVLFALIDSWYDFRTRLQGRA